jgi:hypothetical protein
MTNDQIPITNLTEKDRTDRPYRFLFDHWLLPFSLVIGIWSLVIILSRRDQLVRKGGESGGGPLPEVPRGALPVREICLDKQGVWL